MESKRERERERESSQSIGDALQSLLQNLWDLLPEGYKTKKKSFGKSVQLEFGEAIKLDLDAFKPISEAKARASADAYGKWTIAVIYEVIRKLITEKILEKKLTKVKIVLQLNTFLTIKGQLESLDDPTTGYGMPYLVDTNSGQLCMLLIDFFQRIANKAIEVPAEFITGVENLIPKHAKANGLNFLSLVGNLKDELSKRQEDYIELLAKEGDIAEFRQEGIDDFAKQLDALHKQYLVALPQLELAIRSLKTNGNISEINKIYFKIADDSDNIKFIQEVETRNDNYRSVEHRRPLRKFIYDREKLKEYIATIKTLVQKTERNESKRESTTAKLIDVGVASTGAGAHTTLSQEVVQVKPKAVNVSANNTDVLVPKSIGNAINLMHGK
ncbi:MAG: hypothetical protein ABI597_05530 [Gammaproteobacteria bacterium]